MLKYGDPHFGCFKPTLDSGYPQTNEQLKWLGSVFAFLSTNIPGGLPCACRRLPGASCQPEGQAITAGQGWLTVEREASLQNHHAVAHVSLRPWATSPPKLLKASLALLQLSWVNAKGGISNTKHQAGKIAKIGSTWTDAQTADGVGSELPTGEPHPCTKQKADQTKLSSNRPQTWPSKMT